MRTRTLAFVTIVAGLTGPASRTASAQAEAVCRACHADRPVAAVARGAFVQRTPSITLGQSAHRRLGCVACHTSFDPANPAHSDRADPVNCARCHADARFKHEFHPDLARSQRTGAAPRVTCKGCHGTHDVVSPRDPASPFHESRLVESCGAARCHAGVASAYVESAHGRARSAAVQGAPGCLGCHRTALTATGRPVDRGYLKTVQERLCLTCHLDSADVRGRVSRNAGFVSAAGTNPHGALLRHGKADAASCVDCHGSHEIRPPADAASRVNRANVATACGTCHDAMRRQLAASVHAAPPGVRAARADSLPVCSTCHVEHSGLPRSDPAYRVAAAGRPAEVCGTCHAPVAIAPAFRIAGSLFNGFTDSYHGFAVRGRALEARNCASCHGAHDIRPAPDPASTVSRANLIGTCGRCHPTTAARFAAERVHDPARQPGAPGS